LDSRDSELEQLLHRAEAFAKQKPKPPRKASAEKSKASAKPGKLRS